MKAATKHFLAVGASRVKLQRSTSAPIQGGLFRRCAFHTMARMAYIPYIEEEIAPEQLRAIYDRHRDPNGHVDNILKIHGPNPPSLEAHAKLYVTLMRGKSELTRAQREMIAVVVSSINECHY